jgi:hypothetical protein
MDKCVWFIESRYCCHEAHGPWASLFKDCVRSNRHLYLHYKSSASSFLHSKVRKVFGKKVRCDFGIYSFYPDDSMLLRSFCVESIISYGCDIHLKFLLSSPRSLRQPRSTLLLNTFATRFSRRRLRLSSGNMHSSGVLQLLCLGMGSNLAAQIKDRKWARDAG